MHAHYSHYTSFSLVFFAPSKPCSPARRWKSTRTNDRRRSALTVSVATACLPSSRFSSWLCSMQVCWKFTCRHQSSLSGSTSATSWATKASILFQLPAKKVESSISLLKRTDMEVLCRTLFERCGSLSAQSRHVQIGQYFGPQPSDQHCKTLSQLTKLTFLVFKSFIRGLGLAQRFWNSNLRGLNWKNCETALQIPKAKKLRTQCAPITCLL